MNVLRCLATATEDERAAVGGALLCQGARGELSTWPAPALLAKPQEVGETPIKRSLVLFRRRQALVSWRPVCGSAARMRAPFKRGAAANGSFRGSAANIRTIQRTRTLPARFPRSLPFSACCRHGGDARSLSPILLFLYSASRGRSGPRTFPLPIKGLARALPFKAGSDSLGLGE
jgi:hypothetical protein